MNTDQETTKDGKGHEAKKKALWFLPGLRVLLGVERQAATHKAVESQREDLTESQRRALAMQSEKLALEAETTASHIESNTDLINGIEQLINFMKFSSFKSPDRELAQQHLENASMRLRRELGSPDEE